MTDLPAPALAPASAGRLRLVLILLAVLETLGIFSTVAVLSGDLSDVPGRSFGGALVLLELVLTPVFAVAALIFAIRGNLRFAIVAIAGIAFLVALSYLPSAVLHGLHQDGSGLHGLHATAKLTLFPLLALAAIALALRNERLGLATALASVPMIAGVLGFVAFGLGVGLHGF